LESFDGRSKFRTWIFGIAIHKIKDYYRRVGRVPSLLEFVDGIVRGEESKGIEQAELSESVWSLAGCLPEGQLEVIDLHYRFGMTLAEISIVLERNLNTVKYQFCQAHAKMAKAARHGGWL
jgi:RNA polymerase sigma-70 factor (ECF subfamily)